MKALRGYLLKFLFKIYPKSIEELNIISVFYQYYTDAEIKKALHYLVDKGYVEKTTEPFPGFYRKKLNFYKITAKGIDLIEGTWKDEGIVFEEEEE
ncbi:MAG: hypothetical protein N3A69_12615 [Leptospiraceae bacterium]|nr:hypothetical protein [Leptospiraceae bacterium]